MPETQGGIALRRAWSPPTGTLGDLVARAHVRAAAMSSQEQIWLEKARHARNVPSFREALMRDTVGVIAEVKRSSPSKGPINPGLNAAQQARAYHEAGAVAISVLTEPDRFGGSSADLEDVAAAVPIPILRKDFNVAPVQLYEARALGASAALLIVRALDPALLERLHKIGSELGLELLVEIRDGRELELALSVGARMLGVNNRDLESLVMDPTTSSRLIPLIPSSAAAVAESGLSSRADVEGAARAGADAVLVGSAVSAAPDPRAAVAALGGIPVLRNARPD